MALYLLTAPLITVREISTTREEIINLFFQEFIFQTSIGQRPHQCLNKSKMICDSHGK